MTKKNTTTDDRNLFRSTIGTVKPISSNTVILKPNHKPKPRPHEKPLEAIDPLQNSVSNDLETLYQEDKIAFIAPGLQKNVIRKLRQGYYGLDAEIDLHGLSSRDAQQQLLGFIHHCVEDGFRCIQIIHGKGYNSPDHKPILKNDINILLRRHQDILAFCSAPPQAGGAGAVFVLLRLSDKFFDSEHE